MCSGLGHLSWDNPVVLIPALLIMIMIPLTFSIADGIGIGFISYVALRLGCTGDRGIIRNQVRTALRRSPLTFF